MVVCKFLITQTAPKSFLGYFVLYCGLTNKIACAKITASSPGQLTFIMSERFMKKNLLSPSVLIYIAVVCLLWSANPLLASEEVLVYDGIWRHSLELAGTLWDEWSGPRTPLNWYIGGKIAYYRHDYEEAERCFLAASRLSAPKWLELAARSWSAAVANPSAPINRQQNGLPAFLSELAILLKEKGDTESWRLAWQAINACDKSPLPVRYWRNLAMSCPADKQLWQRALQISLKPTPGLSPLFDPGIFLSLQRFVARFGPPTFCQEFQPQPGKGYLAWAGCDLWRLAWDYSQRGFEYRASGEQPLARWHWNAALAIYDLAFITSKRGNLAHFPANDLVRYSRVLLACHRYDVMLFYFYRPDNSSPFLWLNSHFRPALQLLAASQMVDSHAHQPEDWPVPSSIVLIKYRWMFLGRQLARSADR